MGVKKNRFKDSFAELTGVSVLEEVAIEDAVAEEIQPVVAKMLINPVLIPINQLTKLAEFSTNLGIQVELVQAMVLEVAFNGSGGNVVSVNGLDGNVILTGTNIEYSAGVTLNTQIDSKASDVSVYKLDGTNLPTATLDMNNNLIVGVLDPTTALGVANKNYVDNKTTSNLIGTPITIADFVPVANVTKEIIPLTNIDNADINITANLLTIKLTGVYSLTYKFLAGQTTNADQLMLVGLDVDGTPMETGVVLFTTNSNQRQTGEFTIPKQTITGGTTFLISLKREVGSTGGLLGQASTGVAGGIILDAPAGSITIKRYN